MTKLYQVMNFQHDPVKTFKTLDEAKAHIDALIKVYQDEGFYIIELTVVYSKGK